MSTKHLEIQDSTVNITGNKHTIVTAQEWAVVVHDTENRPGSKRLEAGKQ